jgi:hypothetical protein
MTEERLSGQWVIPCYLGCAQLISIQLKLELHKYSVNCCSNSGDSMACERSMGSNAFIPQDLQAWGDSLWVSDRGKVLIHQLKKKIRVGNLNSNIGQVETFQRTTGRWSSHEVSNSNGLKVTDFPISTYFPANKIQEEIWPSPDNIY